ncbi:MAG: CHASE2 domain-containing protein [Chthoniobacterales bacterium]
MGPQADKRTWRALGRAFLPVVLLGVCAGWSVLSQIPVVPGLRGPVLLGPDGFLSFLEKPTIDARFNFRGEIPSPLKLIYVDVDSDSIKEFGNFPWNRAIFASVIDALFRFGKIRANGFDFDFSDAGIPNLGHAEAEEGSMALGRSIRDHQSVVVAASYSSGLGVLAKKTGFPFLSDRRVNHFDADLPELPGFPVVGPTWGRVGLIDVANDDVRSVPMFAQTQHQTYLAMALQLALMHYGLPESAAEIGTDAIVLRGGKGEAARIPLWLRQLVEVNWFSAWNSDENLRASVRDVLLNAQLVEEGTPQQKQDALAAFSDYSDDIVLVGPTDPMLKDVSPIPMNEGVVPRVSVHGNLLKTIVGGRYIKRPPVWANVLLIFGLGLGVAALAMAGDRSRSKLGRWFSLVLALGYVGAAFALFARFDLLIPIVAPIGAAFSCALVGIAARLSSEEERRQRIKGLFGSYVSSAVVDEIVDKDILPQTGGAEVEVTAFFSDVVSFTSLSQKLSPTELVALMSEYFAEGTAAITAAGGTLDKYVGDAIIAMFGAPLQRADHAAAACRAALALVEAQAALRRRWSQVDKRFPAEVLDMRTRVGLNTGIAVVGNIGSELRFNYTMMGASVNLAQRLEAAAALSGAEILVSAHTAEVALRDDASLVFRELDRVLFPGQTETVTAFQLLASGDEARRRNAARNELYARALNLYRTGNWAEAADAFMAAAEHEPSARRVNPCVVMANRCESFALQSAKPSDFFALAKN